MKKIETVAQRIIELTLPWLVLAILILYTYAKFYEHPYAGFRLNAKGDVILIFALGENGSALQIGDQVTQVNTLSWEDFHSDLRKRVFEDIRAGQVIQLAVIRNGQALQIPWQVPESTAAEFQDLLVSEGWLGFFFWLAGTIALMGLRPRNERWVLFISFNYLTAIWLIIGSGVSFYHIWDGAILLRMAIWLCVPVYLHFHWIFPEPFKRIPKPLLIAGYSLAGILGLAEWLQLLPVNLYSIGFLVAISGSFLFLLLHPLFQPSTRRNLRLLLIISLLSFFPAIVGSIISPFLGTQYELLAEWLRGGGALLGLPILPLAYLYSAYRNQLVGSEIRVNRFFAAYVFILIIGFIELPIIFQLDRIFTFPGKFILIGLVASIFTVLAGVWGYPLVENFVEQWILGIPLPSKSLLEAYSNHITTSTSLSALIKVLQDELLPSLLVRQFIFLQMDHDVFKVLFSMGVDEEQVPKTQDISELTKRIDLYLPSELSEHQPYAWMRLILPLKFGEEIIGLWLFGRRDPDDLYAQAEIPILRSLANQTAVALSNILQTRQLKEMYEADILRQEQERLRLARDLHDSVLNELAALVTSDDVPILSPKIQQAYEAVTERVREIVSDLRPPMLTFGLKLALDGLADNLMERNRTSTEIAAHITANGDCRYTETVEINLYRIVQEACQNSLHYAHAKTIQIMGRLSFNQIDITVQDDGIGFVTETSLMLSEMAANKHFGLLNMLERANLIGAEIKIDSSPGHGTKVQVLWVAK
jgi:signal transduction histidine kinase